MLHDPFGDQLFDALSAARCSSSSGSWPLETSNRETECKKLLGLAAVHSDGCDIHFAPPKKQGEPWLVRFFQGIVSCLFQVSVFGGSKGSREAERETTFFFWASQTRRKHTRAKRSSYNREKMRFAGTP